MESEKNRKNKKKKNKQNKAKEDAAVIADEKVSSDQQSEQDALGNGISEKVIASDNVDGNLKSGNGDGVSTDAERIGNRINDSEALATTEAESEKKHRLQREVMLEETVNQLQCEKDTHLRRAARLEMRVVELEHENESLHLKQASMEGTISQLVTEKTSVVAKQANLEERIRQLIEDNILLNSKLAENEERVKHLESDKYLWIFKEEKLAEMIKNLEVDKESWSSKQTSIEEMVGRLCDDNKRLQNQVNELEESKIRILQEKQTLQEKMFDLQAQPRNGEASAHIVNQENSEISMLNSQIEAASNLIEKLVTENAELVEKVNELYTELDRLRTPSKIAATQRSPDSDTYLTIDYGTVLDSAGEINKSLQKDWTESTKIYPIQAASNGGHERKLQHSSASDASIATDSGEIVQIPLSESELQDAGGQKIAYEDEDSPVELSDAPLTGAPIRFISFVARYVSGADLVSKNPTNSGN